MAITKSNTTYLPGFFGANVKKSRQKLPYKMKGTIKSHFPKPNHKGTFIVIISPEDGSPDIYEEMNEVGDKSELPEVGSEVELAPSWPTWKVKF